jgi:hypothetical protein
MQMARHSSDPRSLNAPEQGRKGWPSWVWDLLEEPLANIALVVFVVAASFIAKAFGLPTPGQTAILLLTAPTLSFLNWLRRRARPDEDPEPWYSSRLALFLWLSIVLFSAALTAFEYDQEQQAKAFEQENRRQAAELKALANNPDVKRGIEALKKWHERKKQNTPDSPTPPLKPNP